jgi:hypothetical protein
MTNNFLQGQQPSQFTNVPQIGTNRGISPKRPKENGSMSLKRRENSLGHSGQTGASFFN